MLIRPLLVIALLLCVVPAHAADAPSGPYLFDLLKQKPYLAAWNAMLAGAGVPAWVKKYQKTFDGPSSPSKDVPLQGKVYSLGWVCKAWVAAFAQDHEQALIDSELGLSASHGKFEKLMADSAQGVVLAGAGQADAALSILERVRREIIRCGYLVQLTAIEIPCGIAMVGTGGLPRWNILRAISASTPAKMSSRMHTIAKPTHSLRPNQSANPSARNWKK